jgi:hypothetical protein
MCWTSFDPAVVRDHERARPGLLAHVDELDAVVRSTVWPNASCVERSWPERFATRPNHESAVPFISSASGLPSISASAALIRWIACSASTCVLTAVRSRTGPATSVEDPDERLAQAVEAVRVDAGVAVDRGVGELRARRLDDLADLQIDLGDSRARRRRPRARGRSGTSRRAGAGRSCTAPSSPPAGVYSALIARNAAARCVIRRV